jgi:hypothetical protein
VPWLAVDVVLVLAALALLALAGLRLWRSVKALGHRVSEAGERLGTALDDLELAQSGLLDRPVADGAAAAVPAGPTRGSTRVTPPAAAR